MCSKYFIAWNYLEFFYLIAMEFAFYLIVNVWRLRHRTKDKKVDLCQI